LTLSHYSEAVVGYAIGRTVAAKRCAAGGLPKDNGNKGGGSKVKHEEGLVAMVGNEVW
jgi:hypothetical protein